MPNRTYRDLIAWQRGIDLVVAVYEESKVFPKDETFGLRSQMRKAALSIPSNIAEGHGRRSRGQDRQFLLNARGSLQELETQIIVAVKLELLSRDAGVRLFRLARATAKPLSGLIRRIDRITPPTADR